VILEARDPQVERHGSTEQASSRVASRSARRRSPSAATACARRPRF
jgi:hypothetical protein